VLNCPALVVAVLSSWAWWPSAILADLLSCALHISVGGYVLLTGGIWNTFVKDVLVDITWVSTLATSTRVLLAVDEDLSVKSNWSWVLVLGQNVESIGKSRGSSLSPA